MALTLVLQEDSTFHSTYNITIAELYFSPNLWMVSIRSSRSLGLFRSLAFFQHCNNHMESTFHWPVVFLRASSLSSETAAIRYCIHMLRILGYSGFPWVVATNTGIFLRGL